MAYQSMGGMPYPYYHAPYYQPNVHTAMSMQQYNPFASPVAQRPAELGLADLPPNHHHHHHPRFTTRPPNYTHALPYSQQNMAYLQPEEDLKEFQALSNAYEPEATVSRHSYRVMFDHHYTSY